MIEKGIALETSNKKRADAYRKILDYYGVRYMETQHDIWHVNDYAKTVYGFYGKTCKSIEKMIFRDIKELDKPQGLRHRNAIGSDYLRRV